MKINQALYEWVNRQDKPRVKGRFYASDIYKIKRGYLNPKNFYDKSPIEGAGIGNVLQGIAGEDLITRIFTDKGIEFTPQAHNEIKIEEGIVISMRADFLFRDKLFEAKAPVSPLNEIPERYQDQCEVYFRAFNVPVYLLEIKFNPFSLVPWEYKPSEERWQETIKAVKDLHSKIK
jgi:hypothetical protein